LAHLLIIAFNTAHLELSKLVVFPKRSEGSLLAAIKVAGRTPRFPICPRADERTIKMVGVQLASKEKRPAQPPASVSSFSKIR